MGKLTRMEQMGPKEEGSALDLEMTAMRKFHDPFDTINHSDDSKGNIPVEAIPTQPTSMTSNRLASRYLIPENQITNKGTNGDSNHNQAIIRHEEQPITPMSTDPHFPNQRGELT